jgi:hypothetical protein
MLRINDALAGKRIKCPGCGAVTVAEPADEADEADEAVQEAPPKKKPVANVAARAPVKKKPPVDDDEDEAPAPPPRKKRPADDDDDDEAPPPRGKRRRDEDEDEDEPKPKKKKKKKQEAASNAMLIWLLAGGGGAVALIAIVVVVIIIVINANSGGGGSKGGKGGSGGGPGPVAVGDKPGPGGDRPGPGGEKPGPGAGQTVSVNIDLKSRVGQKRRSVVTYDDQRENGGTKARFEGQVTITAVTPNGQETEAEVVVDNFTHERNGKVTPPSQRSTVLVFMKEKSSHTQIKNGDGMAVDGLRMLELQPYYFPRLAKLFATDKKQIVGTPWPIDHTEVLQVLNQLNFGVPKEKFTATCRVHGIVKEGGKEYHDLEVVLYCNVTNTQNAGGVPINQYSMNAVIKARYPSDYSTGPVRRSLTMDTTVDIGKTGQNLKGSEKLKITEENQYP